MSLSARRWGALLLLLSVPGCAARPPVAVASPLAGVDLFGTRALTAEGVRAAHGSELDSIASAFAAGRIDEAVIARYLRVVGELRPAATSPGSNCR